MAAAICSRVVFPAPLGPRITQRSSSSTTQSMPCTSSVVPRRTDTSTNCSTASALISATRQSKRTRRVAARACQSAGPTTSVTVALCDAPSGPVQETFTDCPGR